MTARALAAAQTVPVRGDVRANLAQHVDLIRIAAGAGAGIVVFPELSLTGYELDLAAELAFSEADARLAPLAETAASCRLSVLVGAPVQIGPDRYIGAFVMAPDGAIDLYTKHHLGAFAATASPDGIVPPAEATVFRPGTRNPLIRLGGHEAAVAVCADIGCPAHAAAAAGRGADVYLASTFVIPSDFERDTARLRSYAAGHRMAVVFSNYGGPSGGLPSAGQSAIWSDTGELLAQLPARGAGVVVARERDGGWNTTLHI